MKFKAYYFDLDGTLFKSPAKSASDNLLQVLHQLGARGFNTYRSLGATQRHIDNIGISLPTISLLGTQIWDQNNHLIKSFAIPQTVIDRILAFGSTIIDRIKIARAADSNSQKAVIYFKSEADLAHYRETKIHHYHPNIITTSFTEFLKLTREIEPCLIQFKSDTFLPELPSDLSGTVETYSAEDGLTFTPKGVSKVSSFLYICEKLDLDPKEVLSAGDDIHTDSPIFQFTYGISVGKEPLPYAQKHVQDPDELAQLLLSIHSPGITQPSS